MKTKKAQFYLFAALIFVSAVFLVVANSSSISLREIDDFETYQKNYLHEAKIVINNAIMDNLNISDQLGEYTSEYISYLSSKDIDLGVLILLASEDKIYIDNYLNEPVLISTLGFSLNPGEKMSTGFREELEVEYRNETYSFSFSGSYLTELKTLFVKEK